jgi:hypothetical protein
VSRSGPRARRETAPATAQVFLDSLLGEGRPGPLRLAALGAGAAALAVGFGLFAFRREASLVLVFLTALGVGPTVDRVLADNREALAYALKGDRPDARLARSLLAVFAGAFALFAAVASFAEPELARALFARQLQRYPDTLRLAELDFGSTLDVARHNALVTATVLLVAMIYRAGGVALVLLWNASVWGAVLGWLTRASTDGGPSGVLGVGLRLGAGLVALGPHLVLEGLGYVLAAMAGVSIGRGLVKGGHPSEVRRPLAQLAAALGVLGLGAVVEGLWPARALAALLGP